VSAMQCRCGFYGLYEQDARKSPGWQYIGDAHAVWQSDVGTFHEHTPLYACPECGTVRIAKEANK